MSTENQKPLLWVPGTSQEVLKKMLQNKLEADYQRPSRLDIEAQHTIITAGRPTCLFYEVGVRIFYVHERNHYFISDGYNGPSKGDDDPRVVGCARVVNGELQQGKGLCRGSHAEINAIDNASNIRLYNDVRMMVTLHPCYKCAIQIVNAGIKKVYYIWEYGRDEVAVEYFKRLKVEVIKYTSPFLQKWIDLNDYDPATRQER